MEPEVRHKPVRYHEIDLLRFIAALSVVIYHFTFAGYHAGGMSPVRYPKLEDISKYGFLGVQLFFVISGYVVLLSVQGKTLSQFFISRVTRLYPAFWVACTICFTAVRLFAPVATAPGQVVFDSSLGHYIVNMTMLQAFVNIPHLDGVYWTLTYELIFYFLIAVMMSFGWLKHLVLVLTCWLGYCALASIALNTGPFSLFFFPEHAPFFIAGMTFYLLQSKQAARWKLYLLLLASYSLGLRACLYRTQYSIEYYNYPFSKWVTTVLITFFFIVFLLIIYRKLNVGQSRLVIWAGALTYPIYLSHHTIGYIALQRLGITIDKYTLLASMLVGVFILAFLIHVFIELRYSNLLRKKLQHILAASTATPSIL